MKFLLTVFGFLFISNAAMAIDKSGNYAIWGVGMKSCFAFNSITINYLNPNEEVEEKNDDIFFKQWAKWIMKQVNRISERFNKKKKNDAEKVS